MWWFLVCSFSLDDIISFFMIDKSTIVNREFLSGGTLDLFFTKFSWFPLQYTCIKCIVKTKLLIFFPFCLKSACCICGALSLPRLNFSKFPSQLQQNPHLQVFFNPVFFLRTQYFYLDFTHLSWIRIRAGN